MLDVKTIADAVRKDLLSFLKKLLANMPIVVLVTIPQKYARSLAKTLLKKRVCACVNILKGIESLFWWQGKIDTEKEALLFIKTKDSAFSKLKKVIKCNHPYDLPEIIALKVGKINNEYHQWLDKEIHV